ncbi:MAG: hypothetical protein MR902_03520 [Campylobacter sp.]|nr:hypothetical protein [Campylobacter sp.]
MNGTKITNLASATQGTDSVNLNQLNQAMRVTNENIKELRDEARADVASAVALGGII